jgi:hypothetical protein
MVSIKRKKKFISFLKKKGIYASYRKNISSPIIRRQIKNGCASSIIIGESFDWYETKEGRYFWGTIDNKWFNICSNRRIIYSDIKDFYNNI